VCGIATNICCFSRPAICAAGFAVVMVEDASAGIDVLAANLFQKDAKKKANARHPLFDRAC
jgi:nicotinamidase/pyrazinamidase